MNTPDARYTVSKEGTGSLAKQQVARFCDDWIGCYATQDEAAQACCEHNDLRTGPAGPLLNALHALVKDHLKLLAHLAVHTGDAKQIPAVKEALLQLTIHKRPL